MQAYMMYMVHVMIQSNVHYHSTLYMMYIVYVTMSYALPLQPAYVVHGVCDDLVY